MVWRRAWRGIGPWWYPGIGPRSYPGGEEATAGRRPGYRPYGTVAGMTRLSRISAAIGAAAIAAGLALAGCGGGSHPHATASASPTMTEAQLLAIGREYSQCVRDHGVAGFPDMLVRDGRLVMPVASGGVEPKLALANNPQAEQACRSILDRIPAAARKAQTYTAADLAKLRQFAQCMRQNGVPDWPDPRADGSFPLQGTPLGGEGKSTRVVGGFQACRQYWDGGIVVS